MSKNMSNNMSEAMEKFPAPSRLVHEPARLAILTVLSSCESTDFLFLEQVTGLSKGNLSVQLTNLEAAGLIEIRKELAGKKTHTMVSLTDLGRKEIQAYWETMEQLRTYRVVSLKTQEAY
jgi:DNA-binding MarR family transcriptional regulator